MTDDSENAARTNNILMNMRENFTKGVEDAAATVFETISGLFGGAKEPLDTAPSDGRVTLPDDLFAQPGAQTEWWYYTGHCETEAGRRFGFEFVFFKRRTDLDKIGPVPMTLLANPMYFAHFAISDELTGQFTYDHIRSFGGPLEPAVSMSETACDITLGDWSLREVAGKHILHATLPDGTIFDAVLESKKPFVPNGDNGITKKGSGASKHFSFTRMHVDGRLQSGGEAETFTGAAWMDREYGIWQQGDWDWFSIQFNDDTELMIYQFKTASGDMNGPSTGSFVNADGTVEYLSRSDFEIMAVDTWTSPGTGAVYPSTWLVKVERLGIDIEIKPLIKDQELDTRGSTMIVYWEGACSVTGTKNGHTATGRAYVELVGYDRSHENIDMFSFLFADPVKRLRQLF